MAVKTAILGSYDRMARMRQLAAEAVASGANSDFWVKIDASADEVFENRVASAIATAVDTASQVGINGSVFKKLLNAFASYARIDLALTGPDYLAAYLAHVGERCPYEAAEAIVDALGTSRRLAARYVFPKGTVTSSGDQSAAGMYRFLEIQGETGASTLLDNAGVAVTTVAQTALDTKILGAVIMLVNLTATCSIGTSLVLTCYLQDGTTKDITIASLDSSDQYARQYVGKAAVDSAGALAGAVTIPIKVSTAQFKASEFVFISKADRSVQEVAQIDSVASGSITLKAATPLKNAVAENDLVIPMFTNIVLKSGAMTSGKDIALYAMPDRTIAL